MDEGVVDCDLVGEIGSSGDASCVQRVRGLWVGVAAAHEILGTAKRCQRVCNLLGHTTDPPCSDGSFVSIFPDSGEAVVHSPESTTNWDWPRTLSKRKFMTVLISRK